MSILKLRDGQSLASMRRKGATPLPVVRQDVQRKIRATLLSGTQTKLSVIAKSNGVTVQYVRDMLNNDPELRASYETSLAQTAERIEEAAVSMCLDEDTNAIARQKMIEFMLPKLMPERYSEQAQIANSAGLGVKRIAVVATLPVIKVDSDGIPIQEKSKDPTEIIDVKSTEPLKGL